MIANVASYWPAWLALLLTVIAALNQAISESQKFANLLGGWARKLHARAKMRHRMDAADFSKAVREAVNDERERWEKDEARALVAMEGRLNYVTDITKAQQGEMETLSWDVRCLTAYTEYEADWHHRIRMLLLRAEANGGTINIADVPDHMHYQEFETQCRAQKNMNWRSWPKG